MVNLKKLADSPHRIKTRLPTIMKIATLCEWRFAYIPPLPETTQKLTAHRTPLLTSDWAISLHYCDRAAFNRTWAHRRKGIAKRAPYAGQMGSRKTRIYGETQKGRIETK